MDAINTQVVILAVSRMGNQVCVAGVDEDKKWVRPTSPSKEGGWEFKLSDIYDKNNDPVIALSNTVAIRLIKRVPAEGSPQKENWEYDRRQKPVLVEILSEQQRLKLFQAISEKKLEPLVEKNEKSLCLIEPSFIFFVNLSNISVKGKWQPRISFAFNEIPYEFPVTDIYWRAICRSLQKKTGKKLLDGGELKKIIGYNRIFLTIGLPRGKIKNQYWPMIVGVHPVPLFPIKIDYRNP